MPGWDSLRAEMAGAAAAGGFGSNTATANSTAVVSDISRLFGAVSAAEKVAAPPLKFLDLVATAFADSMEHGGAPRASSRTECIS